MFELVPKRNNESDQLARLVTIQRVRKIEAAATTRRLQYDDLFAEHDEARCCCKAVAALLTSRIKGVQCIDDQISTRFGFCRMAIFFVIIPEPDEPQAFAVR
ncbi:MAG TPA: hypothetical protein VGN17_28395 [Bryobacteraceae bacterium]|jgi:hypothetical protein